MASIPDETLLSTLLSLAAPGTDTVGIATRVLARHHTLAEAVTALHLHPAACDGIDIPTSISLQALIELAARVVRFTATRNPPFGTTEAVVAYCRLRAAAFRVETFHVLHFDGSMRLIADDLHQEGTVDEVRLDTAGVIRRALTLNATAIIVAHGAPRAEPPDPLGARLACRDLENAGTPVRVSLREFLLIGLSSYRRLAGPIRSLDERSR